MNTFSNRLKEAMELRGLKQVELAKAANIQPSAITRYLKGEYEAKQDNLYSLAKVLNVSESWLMGYDTPIERMNRTFNLCTHTEYADNKLVTIRVYGSIPAGVPLEAVQDISEYIEIPEHWTIGDKRFAALKVKGDSMYPKYLDGDVVILQLQPDCESGQDCACYVNGYDATLKTVIKGINAITLKPYNPNYPPITYSCPGEVSILGVVKELRRKI